MNRYDNEAIIINDFQNWKKKDILLFPHSLKLISIRNSIYKKKQWKNWINSSLKSSIPPDFYNKKKKLMMDVMRIDDHAYVNEKGKVINPNNKRESEIIKEIINRNEKMKQAVIEGYIFINPDSGLRGEKDHNYKYYINNFKRVINNHISKINNYKNNHPGFKTIFFICDESSMYVKPINGRKTKRVGEKFLADEHIWWKDKRMIDCLKNSKIDFLIWMAPYKFYETEIGISIPPIIIIDVKRINYNKLINYNSDDIRSIEI